MYVSSGQIYVFISCVCFGGIAGIIYSVYKDLTFRLKNTILRALFSISAFVLISLLYVLYSAVLRFPNYRIYMTVGVLIGMILYVKSFHLVLAKLSEKLYNKLKKKSKSKGEHKCKKKTT